MKKAVFFIFLALIPFINLIADPPGPPNPGGSPTSDGGVPVGGPVGNGLIFLLALGILFGAYKIYEIIRSEKLKKEESA
jgi:hypothetical protein